MSLLAKRSLLSLLTVFTAAQMCAMGPLDMPTRLNLQRIGQWQDEQQLIAEITQTLTADDNYPQIFIQQTRAFCQNPNSKQNDMFGFWTFLRDAVEHECFPLVKLAIQKGAPMFWTYGGSKLEDVQSIVEVAATTAARSGNLDILRYLLPLRGQNDLGIFCHATKGLIALDSRRDAPFYYETVCALFGALQEGDCRAHNYFNGYSYAWRNAAQKMFRHGDILKGLYFTKRYAQSPEPLQAVALSSALYGVYKIRSWFKWAQKK